MPKPTIYKIQREHVTDPQLLGQVIYPNLSLECFWCEDWSPEMFLSLARAGFMTICYGVPDIGPILLSQLHDTYSLLDWADLKIDRRVRRLIREGDLAARDIHLRINPEPTAVCAGIRRAYGDECWLTDPYIALMQKLGTEAYFGLRSVGVELWIGDTLVGGELGYCLGNTYTSLTGFLDRSVSGHNHLGKVQLAALARLLEGLGYAFWNLGQAIQEYKPAMGAQLLPRMNYLQRWLPESAVPLNNSLFLSTQDRLSCQELLT